MTEVVVDGKTVRLGNRIGKGGEGEVYILAENHSLAVKLYTVQDATAREAKVAAMVQAGLAKKAPLVAFPLSVARRRDGSFAGFVMPLVAGHKPLHELYSPGSRKQHFRHADYRFLVRVAANVSRAVASVHRSGCVIGDINHSSMLISSKAVAALIDADSFQISVGTRNYLCRVGVPEYTPPELQGRSFDGIVRTANHDAFGLAVVIFQVLFMGRHPFVGTVRRGEIPPLHENIKAYRYVYAEDRDVGMDQPPGTPDVSDFSPVIAKCFDRAFSPLSRDARPTAEEWVRVLDELESSLVVCAANTLHHLPKGASECAWCEMEEKLGTVLFVPYVPEAQLVTGAFDPGAAGFDLRGIWERIEKTRVPQFNLKFGALDISPSAEVVAAASTGAGSGWWRLAIAGIGIAVAFTAPALWILYVPMFLWSAFGGESGRVVPRDLFLRKYSDAAQRFEREIYNWHERAGIHEIASLRKELERARDAYQGLNAEERRLINHYMEHRRANQLHAFLDSFDIQHAQIKGVGPSKKAVLASYGIDTAADVTQSKIMAVPGFGPSNSIPIIEWRRRLESRFVYSTHENATDKQELSKIRAGIEAKAAELRRRLTAGPRNLEALIQRANQVASMTDPILVKAHKDREQARVDLAFLNVPVPAVPAYTPSPSAAPSSFASPRGTSSSTMQAPKSSSATTVASGSTPNCPRCGSSMRRRLARRGRNSGNYFWGCSRYPQCKGTRNI